MKRSKFTEERIIMIPREQESGVKTTDVCRKHGISRATFYKWKSKYGGLGVSETGRLKVLEDENAKAPSSSKSRSRSESAIWP